MKSIFVNIVLLLTILIADSCSNSSTTSKHNANVVVDHLGYATNEKDDSSFCYDLKDCYVNKDSVKQLVISAISDKTVDTLTQFVNIESLILRNGRIENDVVFFKKLGTLKNLESIRIEEVEIDSIIIDSNFKSLKEFVDLDNIFNYKNIVFGENLSIEELVVHVRDKVPKSIKNLNKLEKIMLDVVGNDTYNLEDLLTPTLKEIFIPYHITKVKLDRKTFADINVVLDGTEFLEKEILWYKVHRKFNELCSLKEKGPNLSFISVQKPLDINCN